MKIAAYALSALVIGFASIGSANAAMPSSVPAKVSVQNDGVQLIQHRRDRDYRDFRDRRDFRGRGRGHGHNYRPGGRYSKAPPGWRRHSHRPSYWQSRGCVVVGPVWFCP